MFGIKLHIVFSITSLVIEFLPTVHKISVSPITFLSYNSILTGVRQCLTVAFASSFLAVAVSSMLEAQLVCR